MWRKTQHPGDRFGNIVWHQRRGAGIDGLRPRGVAAEPDGAELRATDQARLQVRNPDAGADQEPTKLPRPTPKVTRLPTDVITPAQLRFVERLITETRSDLEQLLAFFGFESLATIPKSEVNRVIRALESKRRAA